MTAILSLDQGTTSSRAIVFDEGGAILAVAQKEFEQFFPRAGWVEHDPMEIWSSQVGVMTEALSRAGLGPKDLAAVGITNQRETTIVWDRSNGKPICPAIVWQDRRTSRMCDRLRADGHEELIRSKTGLVIDAYFSGSKVAWILDNVADARGRAQRGELAFGTVDSWLVYRLTGGEVHLTDPSNASRTMLYNIHTHAWDDELLSLLNIPREMLPEVRQSSEVYGQVCSEVMSGNVPIAGIAGDQQAALFGQMCVETGLAKNTYGTGCFMLMNTGTDAIDSKANLLTTVAWGLDGTTTYALEGSVFIGGAVVQWLRDGLGLVRSASEIEALANSVPDNGGVYFVPAFSGLGAPHWDQDARGAILGLTRGVTAGHLARAALEGIVYQVADVLDVMRSDSGHAIQELRVDGGAAANDLLLQFQADILGVPIVRPKVTETTALGAAYLAGLAVGTWRDTQETRAQWSEESRFEPSRSADEVLALRAGWAKALERATAWESAEGDA